jgi:hypothetical protein
MIGEGGLQIRNWLLAVGRWLFVFAFLSMYDWGRRIANPCGMRVWIANPNRLFANPNQLVQIQTGF